MLSTFKVITAILGISLVTLASHAKTIDINNLAHYEILKQNINIGIEFTSDMRVRGYVSETDITAKKHSIKGNDGKPATCKITLIGSSHTREPYVMSKGERAIFNSGTQGAIFGGYRTMALTHSKQDGTKGHENVYSVRLDNLPYATDSSGLADAMYGDPEFYPMSYFMKVCDSKFVKFVFVQASK